MRYLGVYCAILGVYCAVVRMRETIAGADAHTHQFQYGVEIRHCAYLYG